MHLSKKVLQKTLFLLCLASLGFASESRSDSATGKGNFLSPPNQVNDLGSMDGKGPNAAGPINGPNSTGGATVPKQNHPIFTDYSTGADGKSKKSCELVDPRMCKDGTAAKMSLDGTCRSVCPEDGKNNFSVPPRTCELADHRICKDGVPSIPPTDGTCNYTCPEDKKGGLLKPPPVACQTIGRVCLDGKSAMRESADSCNLFCPEDKDAERRNSTPFASPAI